MLERVLIITKIKSDLIILYMLYIYLKKKNELLIIIGTLAL